MKTIPQKSLSGPEKAAVLMLVAGIEHASKVFSLLSDDEIKALANAISHLGMVRTEMVHTACARFLEETNGIVGTTKRAEIVLCNVLGKERARSVIEELKATDINAIWEKVSLIDGVTLTNYLKDEQPQTIAVVLSHITPQRAAEVFSLLPQETSCEVLRRILKADNVQSGVLADVGKTLRTELLNKPSIFERKNTHANVAEIFNYMEKDVGKSFFDYLQKNDEEDATRIRALMMTFEDLTKIGIEGLDILLQHIEPSHLALALKAAPECIKEFLQAHLSAEALQLLKDEMETLGAVRVREVNQAQSEIVSVMKELIQKGYIQLLGTSNNEELVL
ncbi:MAG: flagellar motor switch protein FliG [Holosporales bacterium]|jgi:flagellar motor switch protein FliG|nr:flagellar motor switch protein FliG [Holosporales bacterium]